MATVQASQVKGQGVPWRSRLQGPSYFRRPAEPRIKNQYIRTRERTAGGGSRTVTTHYEAPNPNARRGRQGMTNRDLIPTNLGEKTGGVGALEAEFLICIALLVLLMFANSASSYGEKVMSLMKRGTLVCLLFFLLAIISQIGPNAERIAKAFGGLVIVAILITTPANTVISDIDALIKNDWVGTSETGNDTAASADAGTQTGTSPAVQNAVNNSLSTLGDSAVSAMEAWLLHLSGPAASKVNSTIGSILKKIGL